MYEGNYNRFDPSFNFDDSCTNSVLVYDISNNGFTGPPSYNTSGGYIGATGPASTGVSPSNKHIFIDPNHCYYSNPCLLDTSYTRFVHPVLPGSTGPGQFNAQQIISADQYRGFSYPNPNFTLNCILPKLSGFPNMFFNGSLTTYTFIPPSSNSPGTFTYSSDNLSIITVSGNQYTIVGSGSVTITATQAASCTYGYSSASIQAQYNVEQQSHHVVPPPIPPR
jgi:hypothetical protein